jgi:hypothetical protein
MSGLLSWLLACAHPGKAPTGEVAEPEAEGERLVGVMSTLTFARRLEDGTTWGFDLDGRVSDNSDAEGCNKEDLYTPEGTAGVDSAFSAMMPILEATEAGALEGLVADSIANGQLLILVELSGVQDRLQDDCVQMRVLRGKGSPMVGTDGLLLESQTYEVADASQLSECAPIVDGHVEGGPFDLELPMQVLDVELNFEIKEARVRIDLSDEGLGWGYFGGPVLTTEITDIVNEEEDLGDIRDLVVNLVESSADLQPGADGQCGALSIVFEFNSAEAFLWESEP